MSELSSKYHHGNLREELIQAALVLLDEEGIEGVGIRQVARKVGVAHSAPANHFKNKRALFTALAAEIFQDLLVLIEAHCQHSQQNARASVHVFSETIVGFALQYPNRYKLICRTDCIDRENEVLYGVMERVYGQLTVILSDFAKCKNVDVESQAIALWSLIHGYVSLRLEGVLVAGHDSITGAKRQVAIIDVMLDGLFSIESL